MNNVLLFLLYCCCNFANSPKVGLIKTSILYSLFSGHGYGGPDGAWQRSHIPRAPEGARGPAAPAHQSGRGQGAGLRLQGHHTHPPQNRRQSATHRVLRCPGESLTHTHTPTHLQTHSPWLTCFLHVSSPLTSGR